MKFGFKELPGTREDYLRPVVPVTVEGIARAPQLCLLDTGALHNRFAAWVAEAAGIDLGDSVEERLAVGGFVSAARSARVQLTLGDVTWEAPVWFCDPWPLAFHLLGQEGFFRWFEVRLRAARYEIEITPEG
ncbi:MAG TPA: retropepsin-like aspartic protease [Actinomycetota bacterium]|nr:retropepsin-like aspartic protease [Actinomycetota bacterium]